MSPLFSHNRDGLPPDRDGLPPARDGLPPASILHPHYEVCQVHKKLSIPLLVFAPPLLPDQLVVAYIIGTITALVVAADKMTKTYRLHTNNLALYTRKHAIPPELHTSMQEHLLMHLDFADRWHLLLVG